MKTMNNQQAKRIRELGRYAVKVAREDGLPAMAKRTAGFVKRRFFGKKARYLPGKKVLEAPAGRGRTAACPASAS